ncbi:MAG: chorismate synthase [Desulfamplus sp.]|nr:chorismate synthase [Desulfamplus sp.]
MSGSTFGKAFQITTWGESHGKALGVVIQGCPSGIELNEEILQKALDKRKPGQGSAASTKRKEPDIPEILSGVFEGKTTGTPISIMIVNQDAKSRDYSKIAEIFRPGHGDITYQAKYGIRDYRGGGRASARETAARVAAGAVAEAFLKQYGISVETCTLEIGGVGIKAGNINGGGEVINQNQTALDREFAKTNYLECPDPEALLLMEKRIEEVKKEGDSLGGVVEITAKNVPAGLGDPVFDKLDADIAKALMSIGAVKAVEIGAGCDAAKMTGFENNDQILPEPSRFEFDTSSAPIIPAKRPPSSTSAAESIKRARFETNNSGGILAGISNGDDIIARVHVKPIPSILKEQMTVDINGNPCPISTQGRHDICAIPRINPVCKAMVYLVIADHILRQSCYTTLKNSFCETI